MGVAYAAFYMARYNVAAGNVSSVRNQLGFSSVYMGWYDATFPVLDVCIWQQFRLTLLVALATTGFSPPVHGHTPSALRLLARSPTASAVATA
jgi:hypothetical protein